MSTTTINIVRLLQQLESQPDIPGYLRDQHCTGLRLNGTCCPVAVYLWRHSHQVVAVGPKIAVVLDDATKVVIPPRVGRFLLAFDAGRYPDLETEPWDALADST
jgi:hypothetical protein